MDKYLNDPRAAEHVTYINEKMQFHDSEAEDPDWMVRQCYTLIIAGASEMENGVDNLWKKGDASGRRNHPDSASTLARMFSRHSSLQLIFVLQKKNIGTRSLVILLGTFSFHA
jgi:hypothetical protein